jgi:pectate lyase
MSKRVPASFLCTLALLAGCDVGSVNPGPDAGTGGKAPTGGAAPTAGSAGTAAGSGGSSASAGSGGGGGTGATDPIGEGGVPDLGDGPIGWATVPDLGVEGTTGGGDAEPVDVTDLNTLTSLAQDTLPRVLHLRGHFAARLNVGSNKTIVGIGGSSLHGQIHLDGSVNVILRNLVVVGDNCLDDPECRSGLDAINVEGASHHLWFDHMDVSDGSDGNLDITQASDYVTVSWTKFWYSGRERGHRFSNLIGASDNSPSDVGHLKVTFHHNWWTENVDQRMPRTRYGLIHVFNNLYTPSENLYCVNAGMDATLLVENNVFRGPRDPLDVSSTGNLLSVGNVFENTTGQMEETGVSFEPPYDYELDPTDGLPEAIMAGAGIRLAE